MEPVALLVAAALAASAAIGCAVVRTVPAGHRGVVIRVGRPARVRPAGFVAVLPAVERLQLVPVHPAPIDPLGVSAVTRDGVEVRLTISVLWTVTDPALIVQANPTAATATAAAVERALHHLVAGVELTELLREREAVLARVPAAARRQVAVFGVELVDFDLLDAQVQLGPQLLRLLA